MMLCTTKPSARGQEHRVRVQNPCGCSYEKTHLERQEVREGIMFPIQWNYQPSRPLKNEHCL